MSQRYANGGYVPGNRPLLQDFSVTLTPAYIYRCVALARDPPAESWRWQRTGFAAKVETRRIAHRSAR